jgi:hypothetical protein
MKAILFAIRYSLFAIRYSLFALPERSVIFQVFANFGNLTPLALQIVGHRPPQAGMRDVVGRMRRHRHVAARQLVFALRASFHHLQPAFDREIDRLMVADLEMQEWVVLDAAPVAAKQACRRR